MEFFLSEVKEIFNYFHGTQILLEINFRESRSIKTAVFEFSRGSESLVFKNNSLYILRAEIDQNRNSDPQKLQ